MGVFLETTYSSQVKLIGQSLCVSEHGIGYSNLVFSANKGQKRPIFSFRPLKCLEGLEIQSQNINIKRFLIKNPLRLVIFIWPLWLMKAMKDNIQVLLNKCFEKSKFRLNTEIQKSSLQKESLNIGLSVLAFVGNELQRYSALLAQC